MIVSNLIAASKCHIYIVATTRSSLPMQQNNHAKNHTAWNTLKPAHAKDVVEASIGPQCYVPTESDA